MTFAPIIPNRDNSLKLSISTAIYHLIQRFEDYRDFRHTVAELRDLNDAQLSDMGLSRSEITNAALEAVYGPRR